MLKKVTFLLVILSLLAVEKSFGQNIDREKLTQIKKEFQRKYDSTQNVINNQLRKLPGLGKADSTKYVGEKIQYFEGNIPIIYTNNNLDAARHVGTDKLWGEPSLGLNLEGSNQEIFVWDGGQILADHIELDGRIEIVDTQAQISNHATHVGGTIAASGADPAAKGMAPEASLISYDYDQDIGEITDAALNGAYLSNHSYGQYTGWRLNTDYQPSRWEWYGDELVSDSEDYRFGFYDTAARMIDGIAESSPYLLMVFAADNDRDDYGPGPDINGEFPHFVRNPLLLEWVSSKKQRNKDGNQNGYDCISGKAVGKNVLTVGAVEYSGYNTFIPTEFSSWGPTDDGRIKPDVVAPGKGIYSTLGDGGYGLDSGTSMAAPVVTGSVALIREYFQSNYSYNPTSSLLKALVIHSAKQIGGKKGPTYSTGWGIIQSDEAIGIINDDVNWGKNELIKELTITENEEVVIEVSPTNSEPLKVTIVWTDPEGPSRSASLNNRAKHLINDLDLRVSNENTDFLPYILNVENPSQDAFFGNNDVDNVEQVFIENPSSQSYTITISHKGNLQNNFQNFALVITGPVNDDDGDGVPNNIDQCPGTPSGETVDAQGCSVPQNDTQAPVVTSITVTNITSTSFTVDWSLDEGSKGYILFGTTASMTDGTTAIENNFLTSHVQTVGGNNPFPLNPDTPYYWRIYTEDQYGNSGLSAIQITATQQPTDSDGDGVTDDLDQCPDTPDGDSVDEFGCSDPQTNNGPFTLIPDPQFELALLNLSIDTDGIINGQVRTSDISSIQDLSVSGNGITDLQGIEDFASLISLDAYNNQISTVDISNNTNLQIVDLGLNQLTNIDISNNLNIQLLYVDSNQLNALDVSNNLLLDQLIADNNPLNCIQVSVDQLNNIPSGWIKDESSEYSINCEQSPTLDSGSFMGTGLGQGILSNQTIYSFVTFNQDLELNEIEVFLDIEHTYIGDLQIQLTSPSGTTVVLLLNQCESSQNLNVTFSDGGDQLTCGNLTAITGIVIPQDALASFIGESILGQWTLQINDNALADEGILLDFSLELTTVGELDKADIDGDGISNAIDQCMNTPIGTQVDNDGCLSSADDSDNDGISNDLDQCPNTLAGQTVDENGCMVFSYDAFTLYTESTACPGGANGQLEISASAETNGYIFDVQIEGNGVNLNYEDQLSYNNTVSISDMATGTYTVIITSKNGFNIVFDQVVIVETGDLTADKQEVNTIGKTAFYKVTGNLTYSVSVNQKVYSFNVDTKLESTITVPLEKGENDITIKGADCQSVFRDQIVLPGIVLYPNPVSKGFYISGSYNGKVALFTNSGIFIKEVEVEVEIGNYIGIQELPSGVYFVHFLNENKEILKIIKQ